MSTTDEIRALEEKLRQAELGPDAAVFEELLHDDAILDGQPGLKSKVVAAHRPTGSAKFTRVELSELAIVDHGDVAVVTCKGEFEGPKGVFAMRFMRVWQRRDGRWRIVAGTSAMA